MASSECIECMGENSLSSSEIREVSREDTHMVTEHPIGSKRRA
jgi:hypothetical protein